MTRTNPGREPEPRPRTPLSPMVVIVVAALLVLMIWVLLDTMHKVREKDRHNAAGVTAR